MKKKVEETKTPSSSKKEYQIIFDESKEALAIGDSDKDEKNKLQTKSVNPLDAKPSNDLFSESVSLCLSGRYQEALECADILLKRDPENSYDFAFYYGTKGAALAGLERYDEAIVCYNEALKYNIDQIAETVLSKKGLALFYLNRYSESIDCFDKAIALEPNNPHNWIYKANATEKLGKSDEAFACYNNATLADPQNAYAWGIKGHFLLGEGRYEEAIDCFDKALKLEPQNADFWCDKGHALVLLQKFDPVNGKIEFLDCFFKALEIDPQNAQTWYNLGEVDKITGNKERAEEKFSNAGTCFFIKNMFGKAIECSDKVIEINSRNALAWNIKGMSLNNQDKYNEAIQAYDKAIKIDPNYAEAWHNKGHVLNALGHASEAEANFAKAKELGYQS
ncbi:MAG: tetratricopeptide repeat protein [Methanotrichaceae archaeon]|nr:tetratricopeptide repeat protein [Methanotrichaceae archaeon]